SSLARVPAVTRLAFTAANLQPALRALERPMSPFHLGAAAGADLFRHDPERTDSRRRNWSTCSKPMRSRIGRDIGPARTASAGVLRRTASSQRARTTARYAPRPRAHARSE